MILREARTAAILDKAYRVFSLLAFPVLSVLMTITRTNGYKINNVG